MTGPRSPDQTLYSNFHEVSSRVKVTVSSVLLLAASWTAGAGADDAAAADSVVRGRPDVSITSQPSTNEPFTFVTLDGSKQRVLGDEFSVGQLFDPRLTGRVWELEGSRDNNNVLRIHKLFTLKDGKRFRVAYFCVICNIYQHEPGRCMCCQDGTELQEIPQE